MQSARPSFPLTPHVFLPGDWFKMRRIDAQFLPAKVVEGKAFGNEADENLVGDTVGRSMTPAAITSAVLDSRPEPAPLRFVNSTPKETFIETRHPHNLAGLV